jgi:hypothetical protein
MEVFLRLAAFLLGELMESSLLDSGDDESKEAV